MVAVILADIIGGDGSCRFCLVVVETEFLLKDSFKSFLLCWSSFVDLIKHLFIIEWSSFKKDILEAVTMTSINDTGNG